MQSVAPKSGRPALGNSEHDRAILGFVVTSFSDASAQELWARLEALPEHLKGEIIDGQLYVQARPRPRHEA